MTDTNAHDENEPESIEHASLAEAAMALATAEAPATDAAPALVRLPPRDVTERNPICSVGRRKSATARVRMFPGDGTVTVNGRPFEEYFVRVEHRRGALSPLRHCELAKDIDIRINVRGGGDTGQCGAVSMAVSRALAELRPDLERRLRDGGFMTRDSRVGERKKSGRAGARRGFQFSKR